MRIFQRPAPAAELVLILSFTLLACKLGKSKDDPESRELPVVDASAPTPTPPTPPATPQVPVPVPAVPPPTTVTSGAAVTTGSAVKPAGTTGAAAKPATTTGAASTVAASTTGAAATTTGAAQAGTTTGGVVDVTACVTKCGNRMRKCLADAKLGDDVAAKCNGAFQACQRDCR